MRRVGATAFSTWMIAGRIALALGTIFGTRVEAGVQHAGVPRRFIQNGGQWPGGVEFVHSMSQSARLVVDREGLRVIGSVAPRGERHYLSTPCKRIALGVASQSVAFEVKPFKPGGQDLQWEPDDSDPLPFHFFTTRDGETATSVLGYQRLRCREFLPGIDLCLIAGDVPSYELIADDFSAVTEAEFKCAGAERLGLTASGDLEMFAMGGSLRQTRPILLKRDGSPSNVSARFELRGADRFAIVWDSGASPDDVRAVASVDPQLIFASYLGGNANDIVEAVYVNPVTGNVHAVGSTNSSSATFPTTSGAFDVAANGNLDCFVATYSQTPLPGGDIQLAPLFVTFLGGSLDDVALDVTTDDAGNVFVTGATFSSDFPTTSGSFDTTFNSAVQTTDAFVTKLAASGASLVYSTFLGGSDVDAGHAIAITSTGAAYVGGFTASYTSAPLVGFPTTSNAFDAQYSGQGDGFISRIGADGASLPYSTYIGGTGIDGVHALALRTWKDVVVALDSDSTTTVAGGPHDLPVTVDSPGNANAGLDDIYVAALDVSLTPASQLSMATLFGDTGKENPGDLTIDSNDNIYLVGGSSSTTMQGYAALGVGTTTNQGSTDALIVKLDPALSSAPVVYWTFVGGAGVDSAGSVRVPRGGPIYFSGTTVSSGFPTTSGAFDTSYNGAGDVFMSSLVESSPTPGTYSVSIGKSTFYGSTSDDMERGMDFDRGVAFVVGTTNSPALTLRNPFQSTGTFPGSDFTLGGLYVIKGEGFISAFRF